MANIFNTKSNTLLSGTSGSDTIENFGGINVTIDAMILLTVLKVIKYQSQAEQVKILLTLMLMV